MAYPVTFDIQPLQEYDKAQVALRAVILIVLHVLQIGSFIFGGAYLILPVVAAVMISQKGAERYLAEAETGPTNWLRYLMMFYDYMALATDKMATQNPEETVQLSVRTGGSPTVGQALLRIVLAIPHAIVLTLVGIAFLVVWVISAVSILLNGEVPEWASTFIRGYLRRVARLMAYMASLVDEYPPFSFENGSEAMPASLPPAEQPAPSPPSDPP